jgi:NADP-dependent 3-hydroxy acid dehydrogenase YdfG
MFIAKPFTEYTVADFNAKISLNLAGFFYVSQQAIRQMLTQGGGHV